MWLTSTMEASMAWLSWRRAPTLLLGVFGNELLERRGRLLNVRVDDGSQHHLGFRRCGDEDGGADEDGQHDQRQQSEEHARGERAPGAPAAARARVVCNGNGGLVPARSGAWAARDDRAGGHRG